MKSTGMVRRVDDLGRIVIPKELRRTLGINTSDPLEIFVDGERIVLQKYERGCTFCGNADGLKQLFGRPVCKNCIYEIRSLHLSV